MINIILYCVVLPKRGGDIRIKEFKVSDYNANTCKYILKATKTKNSRGLQSYLVETKPGIYCNYSNDPNPTWFKNVQDCINIGVPTLVDYNIQLLQIDIDYINLKIDQYKNKLHQTNWKII